MCTWWAWWSPRTHPGVKRPAMELQPTYLANLRQALWVVGLVVTTYTSCGFSMAAMARAASRSFSQVFFRLMTLTPLVLFLKTYCSMVVSLLSDPIWVVAANILVMSSSVIAKQSRPPDILSSLVEVNQAIL